MVGGGDGNRGTGGRDVISAYGAVLVRTHHWECRGLRQRQPSPHNAVIGPPKRMSKVPITKNMATRPGRSICCTAIPVGHPSRFSNSGWACVHQRISADRPEQCQLALNSIALRVFKEALQ